MVDQHAVALARRGLPDKRRAILAGALTIFARDGYSRASIDAIAAEASVSSRTIYNHFTDKAGLFHAVIEDSAGRIAAAQMAIIDRHLRKVTDVEADLIEFGQAWARPVAEHAEHFALVRQINAELGHIPRATVQAWQRAGPLRVRAELARHIQALADQDLLRVEDPDRAALHLILLATVANPALPGVPLDDAEITAMVTAGVATFLHGHLPR